jgi:hypothetical protein
MQRSFLGFPMRFFDGFAAKSILITTTALSAGFVFSGGASAAITVTTASVSDGKLTLSGRANPNSTIVLDGGIASTKASKIGTFNFGFSFNYIPHRCVVKLSSKDQPTVLVD